MLYQEGERLSKSFLHFFLTLWNCFTGRSWSRDPATPPRRSGSPGAGGPVGGRPPRTRAPVRRRAALRRSRPVCGSPGHRSSPKGSFPIFHERTTEGRSRGFRKRFLLFPISRFLGVPLVYFLGRDCTRADVCGSV